ncbi:MAG: hypothetical protein GX753_00455 [Erysipelothrix sp.]|nr:hypothetical protein [Erysipelothrix sp.]
MSKYDAFLTEVVYEIDDVIYNFYQKSNEVISKKRNQESLFEYRDKTIETVNDMNVRSLEIISSVKKREIVEERAAVLIQRNEEILASALNVIEVAPSRGDLMHEVKEAAAQVLDKAGLFVSNFQKSDTYHNIKEGTVKGYTRLRDKVKEISEDERVKEGIQTAKEKTVEFYHKGEKVVGEGVEKVKEWVDETTHKADNVKDTVADAAEDLKDDAVDAYEDVKENASDLYEEFEDKVEDVTDDVKDGVEDFKDEVEDVVDDAKDVYEDVKETVEEGHEDFIEAARKQLEDLENENV